MYQDAHIEKGGRAGARMNRTAVLLLAIILLISTAVGTTVAFLTTKTEPVENTFEYAKVSCEVTEAFETDAFDTNARRCVQVRNTGTIDAYIRAIYVVNWVDAQGNIVAFDPEGYSYSLTENPDNKWTKIGDYYYYLTPVAPNDSTPGSLLTCTATYPDNPEYTLSVEILAEAIQSTPENAVTDAWGVTVSSKPTVE